MAGNTSTIQLTLTVEDDGSVVIDKFAKGATQQSEKAAKRIKGSFSKAFKTVGTIAAKSLGGIIRQLVSLKGALLAVGVGAFVKSTLNMADNFEQLKVSLDTITKGEGEETFKKLNEWAMTMPVNTSKAIDSYKLMIAMGLTPTIEQMTTLVDTVSSLGGGDEALEGIGRAMGQMIAKGKVSAEELMQLAERGVPAMQILKNEFGNVETATIDVNEAVAALFKGMDQLYGGGAAKQMETFGGLIQQVKGYWGEFVREVYESGLMAYLKEHLQAIVNRLSEMYETGELKAWAIAVQEKAVKALDKVKWALFGVYNEALLIWPDVKRQMLEVWGVAKDIYTAIKWIVEGLRSLKSASDAATGDQTWQIAKSQTGFGMMQDVWAGSKAIAETGQMVWEQYISKSPAVPWEQGLKSMQEDMDSVKNQKMVFDAEQPKKQLRTLHEILLDMSGTGRYRLTAGSTGRLAAAGKIMEAERQAQAGGYGGFAEGTQGLPYTGMFYGHKGEKVTRAAGSNRNGGSGRNITINVNGAGSPTQTARQIRQELERLEARGA